MADIAQRGNKLTNKHISKDLVRNVYEHVAPKHSPGQKKKPHSSKEGRTASLGRTVRDVGKILTGKREDKAEGGRIGLKKGGKPWGTGPKPGTLEFLQTHTQTPRKKKAIGGAIKKVIQGGKKIIDKIKTGKSNKFDTWETIGIPGSPGPKKGKYKHIDTIMERIEKQKKTGKAEGGRIGRAPGGSAMKHGVKKLVERFGGGEKGKPHSSKEGRIAAGKRNIERMMARRKQWKTPGWQKKPPKKYGPGPYRPGQPREFGPGPYRPGQPREYEPAATGGRIGLKKGGSDKKWIQKAVNPKHKGYCTPMTKKTCTPARKALARTFKKKAKTGWG